MDIYRTRDIIALTIIFSFINTVLSGSCLAEKYLYGFQKEHTACISRASTASDYGVSDVEKESILNHHNRLRASITDAGNMQLMSWDDELEAIAQRWSEHCHYDHEKPSTKRAVPGRFVVGQNLAYGYYDWAAAVQGWFNEQKDFSYGDRGQNSFTEVGHYTQIVWATTTKIGCGFSKCSNLRSPKYYVCNYGPAGNIGDWSIPYTKSNSQCSSCAGKCVRSGDNIGLCDCRGRACYNGGTMDLTSCTCNCTQPHYLQNKDCLLDCDKVEDKWFCGTKGWDDCTGFSNIPSACPKMCKFCPYASYDFVDKVVDFENGASITMPPVMPLIVLLLITLLYNN